MQAIVIMKLIDIKKRKFFDLRINFPNINWIQFFINKIYFKIEILNIKKNNLIFRLL